MVHSKHAARIQMVCLELTIMMMGHLHSLARIGIYSHTID